MLPDPPLEARTLGSHVIRRLLKYSRLSLRRTPLGPALSVRLTENQIKGVKKGNDQL